MGQEASVRAITHHETAFALANLNCPAQTTVRDGAADYSETRQRMKPAGRGAKGRADPARASGMVAFRRRRKDEWKVERIAFEPEGSIDPNPGSRTGT